VLARSERRIAPAQQRGLSLVELMVGVAIGLIIVAGAATVAATQLADTRRLTLEAQLQQDLRSASDIIARQVRRAGYWNSATTTIWKPGTGAALNPTPAITLVSPTNVTIALSGSSVTGYYWDGATPGVIWQKFGNGNPAQALTDSNVEDIQDFKMQLAPVASAQAVQMSCPSLCADTTKNCWPTLQPQELIISITGASIFDKDNVKRTIQSTVRIRNDQIVNNNAGGPLCPP
jgi:prepilin-type N-terminal cleavage/methylation domain-containing protein